MRMQSGRFIIAAACLLVPVVAFAANDANTLRDYLTTAPKAVRDADFQKAVMLVDDVLLEKLASAFNLEPGAPMTKQVRQDFVDAVLAATRVTSDPGQMPEGPGGDECLTAAIATDGTTAYDNTTATLSPEAVCDTNMTGSDIWFSYTATCTGVASIAAGCANNPTPDMVLEVDSGPCTALVNEGCVDDSCGVSNGFASNVDIAVVMGTSYFIRLSGWNGGTVTGDLVISCVMPVCGNGILEAGEECDDGGVIPNDGCSATCTLEGACCAIDGTCLENQDQVVCEGTAGSFYAGDSVTCLVAACPTCGDGVVAAPEQCDPPGTATCDAFCQFIAPANDACAAAVALGAPAAGGTVNAIGDNNGATDDATATCGTSDGGVGVWYTVIGTGNSFTATTCNPTTDFDTKLTVFCSGCATPNCVDGNDDTLGAPPACDLGGLNRLSTVSWCTEPGKEYLVMVNGFAGATGNFELTVTDDGVACTTPPGCGSCGDGVCDANEDSCSCTADCGAPDLIETSCSDGLDNDCNGLTDCADTTQCDPASLPAEAACGDGLDNDCDTLIDCGDPDCATDALCGVPVNDNCTGAIPIGDGAFPFNTTFATTDGTDHGAGGPCDAFNQSQINLDIWYSYTSPCTGFLTANTCGSALDTKLAVYAAGEVCIPTVDPADCNDDSCGLQSQVEIPVTMGGVYLVRVGGFSTTLGGTGTLNTVCTVPVCGDGVVDPGEACDDGNTLSGDGCNATCTAAEGACCATDGTCTEFLEQATCVATPGSSYAGNTITCLAAACPVCGDGVVTAPEECEPPGMGNCDAFCRFFPPTNDDCVGATAVGEGTFLFDNANATLDATAPAVCDANMLDDIWFLYTASCTGTATIAAGCNDAVTPDTVLEVYPTGTCPPTAGNLNCADDSCGLSSGFASSTTQGVTSGNAYMIRLSGWNGGTVAGTLEISCFEPAVCGDGACIAGQEDQCNCPADCGMPPANEGAGTCNDGINNDCDAFTDCFDPDCLGIDGCPAVPIPTMSEWGLIVMVMLLLMAGTVVFARRRRAMA